MKKLVFLSIALVISVIPSAQQAVVFTSNNTATNLTERAKTTNEISTIANQTYLLNVFKKDVSKNVKHLQLEVAKFNIKSLKIYNDSEAATYTVNFKRKNGFVTVDYDSNGHVIMSSEKYKNVKLPLAIRVKVAKEYPGWEFKETHYTINYTRHKASTKQYKIKLKKGTETKFVLETL
ncbi:hypothetical protein ACFO5O_13895 [Geojedonia litorea]|uniref:Beta-lactamase-inhibitor-like, PepSY-like n=1 Tax=Geojedonia litorea TaxID=1268269 RepID=A0ABV9NA11_9FLAO